MAAKKRKMVENVEISNFVVNNEEVNDEELQLFDQVDKDILAALTGIFIFITYDVSPEVVSKLINLSCFTYISNI